MPEENSYKLHIDCPNCNQTESMRIHVHEDVGATILCLKCEEGVEIDEDALSSILSAITQKLKQESKDNQEVASLHQWVEEQIIGVTGV